MTAVTGVSVRTRVILYSLLVLFSAALVAGAGALVWVDHRATLERASHGAEAAAQAYAVHASRNLGELRHGVAWLAGNIDPHSPDHGIDPATAETARMLARYLPGLSALFFIDADAHVRFSTVTDATLGADVDDRDYFKAARERGQIEFIGPAIRSKRTRMMVYTLSRRVERNGAFAGVVLASARVERWNDILGPLVPVPGTHVRLVHSDGSVIVAQRTMPNGGGLETVSSGNEPDDPFLASGLIVARMPVTGSDLVAEVAVPREAALARWAARRTWIAAGAILGLIALSVFAFLGHGSLRREAAAVKALEARTEELHQALEIEKLLMTELQHRVKNSLALAAGMLHFERAQAHDSEMRGTLDKVKARILAIGKVHDRLYDGNSPSAVSLDAYLWGLCDDIAANAGIRHTVNADPIIVPSAQAVSLGLIVTELLLNAAKHAGTGAGTRVEVSARATGDGLVLTVRDHGHGIPAGFDVSQSSGLGMRIVSSLVAQLDGRLVAENAGPGTRFTIHIPLEPAHRRSDPLSVRAVEGVQ